MSNNFVKSFSQKSDYDKHVKCEPNNDKIIKMNKKLILNNNKSNDITNIIENINMPKKKTNNIINSSEQPDIIDYTSKTQKELIAICKERHIKGYSGYNKDYIIKLLLENKKTSIEPEKIIKSNKIIKPNNIIESEKIIQPPEINVLSNKLKMVDLFAGTGAFSLAFESTNNVDIVFANDMVEPSKKIYNENFSHTLTIKDLNDVNVEDIPKHDILTGGFPCQPFSIAGHQEGFNDKRSNVFWKILSIIDYHQPKCVILENVKNLVSHDETKTFNTIKSNLEKRGYHLCYKVLNTAVITGIPQHRERIYIVCIKSEKVFNKFSLEFPKIEKKKISNYLEKDIPSKYYYTDKSSTWELVKNNVVKHDTIYQYRRVYVRENKSNECPTLTANMGEGGHNVPLILDSNGIRKLTPRECFNLQGFPSSYKLPELCDSKLYKLVGNAVSVPVVKLIADRIIPLLIED